LTDPSYRGQIVAMTYPEIGNYGINAEDVESARPHLAGFVVRNLSQISSNFRATEGLGEYLRRWGWWRSLASTRGRSSAGFASKAPSREFYRLSTSTTRGWWRRQGQPGAGGARPGARVVPSEQRAWSEPLSVWTRLPGGPGAAPTEVASGKGPHVVAIDYGMKWNIPRYLVDIGCRVTVVPGTASADEVQALKPDGVFLSNGPGDPSHSIMPSARFAI